MSKRYIYGIGARTFTKRSFTISHRQLPVQKFTCKYIIMFIDWCRGLPKQKFTKEIYFTCTFFHVHHLSGICNAQVKIGINSRKSGCRIILHIVFVCVSADYRCNRSKMSKLRTSTFYCDCIYSRLKHTQTLCEE